MEFKSRQKEVNNATKKREPTEKKFIWPMADLFDLHVYVWPVADWFSSDMP